ncbi:MAG: type IV pilus assembly protein PilM [Acidimicrobiia bacterium]
MAKRVIGVDVGTNAVRAAEIAGGDRPYLHRFGQVALPVGAVHEGEVVDVGAVSEALKRLWREVGFGSRSVRVGLASARVIMRIVDVPTLSDAETRSALALQLDEYVPIRIEDTVFDFQPLPPSDDPGPDRQVLLAAAHQDAVRPLVEAVRGAGLRVAAVDVVPAALARAFHDPHLGPDLVDVVVSVGGGTVVVVAARDGLPMFARTITNVSGRSITERIAARLAVSELDAERFKRGDHMDVAGASAARSAAEPAIAELVEEVRDSLDFFGAQPGALPVRRVLLTGGGSLLEHFELDLSDRLGLPVSFADPFGLDPGVPLGFERTDLPFLAPYVPTALGIALAGGPRWSKTLDLTPASTRVRSGPRRPMVVGASASVILLVAGGLYAQRRSAISDELARADAVGAQVVAAQQAAVPAGVPTGDPAELVPSIMGSVAERDVDWLTVTQQLEALSHSVGVEITSVDAVVEPPVSIPTELAAAGSTGASTPVAGAEPQPIDASEVVASAMPVARASIAGTASDANVVAAWLDALVTDDRFADVWITGITSSAEADRSAFVQFSAQLTLTGSALVVRPILEEQPT